MAAPQGNQNGAKSRLFEQHLKAVVNLDNGTKLRKVVEQTLDAAVAGEAWAVQFIADRLDGKAKQQVEISGDQDNPLVVQQSYLDALAGAATLRASHTAGLVDSANPNAYPLVEER